MIFQRKDPRQVVQEETASGQKDKLKEQSERLEGKGRIRSAFYSTIACILFVGMVAFIGKGMGCNKLFPKDRVEQQGSKFQHIMPKTDTLRLEK